jgi:hypothetical protein
MDSLFFVFFNEAAPTHLIGHHTQLFIAASPQTLADPSMTTVIAMACTRVSEDWGGLLRLVPAGESQPPGAAVYVHPHHVLCVQETAQRHAPAGFVRAQ